MSTTSTFLISVDGRAYLVEAAYDAARDSSWARCKLGRAPLEVIRAARQRIKALHEEMRALEFAGGAK